MRKLMLAVLLLALVVPSLSFAADLASDANFAKSCAMCHGKDPSKPGTVAKTPLKNAAAKSNAELTKAITDGVPTSTPKMPAFKGKLTDAQISALVSEIKALK